MDDATAFAAQGYINLGKVLSDEEVTHWVTLFDQDRQSMRYFWHPYGYHQQANYDALITSPIFDGLVRHPRILPRIESLMGDPLCFGEIGLRSMGPYDGELHQSWHRDKPHWQDHPLRMDYMQLIVYLSDVNEDTHCFSISPETCDQPVLKDAGEQLARGGVYDLHGPAGTCALFNASLLHTATTRPTEHTRKSVQIYYGHRDRPALANDSGIPATLWRDHPDPEARAFYGVLNERTRLYLAAFPQPD
jgi:hypothetical protein